MSHQCPAQGCTQTVPFEELACKRHWVKLPWRMRADLSRAFKRRDYDAHQAALEAALDFYATHDVDSMGESRGGHTTTTLDAGWTDIGQVSPSFDSGSSTSSCDTGSL